MNKFESASILAGISPNEEEQALAPTNLHVITGEVVGKSENGKTLVSMEGMVFTGDDSQYIEMDTLGGLEEGDIATILLSGESGKAMSPLALGSAGSIDRIRNTAESAEELAQQVEAIAQEAAEEVEQVRQDVADFRDDVATTYATKVEREDGDDAVKTWVTTNYTNSNDLATTYATKTLVSQTKDAIELAASQTYETQTDAAATYATKSALTVGLDGIRSEVAEDYQPKGDYATTTSMNSAIQQSASSIESTVAATYLKQSDASTTYATKTEVQQTASGLDTRITTAQSTADGAYLERTATGTTVDTTGAVTIRSLVVDGQSVQDGTPSPSAPIPIKSVEGANLYDPTKAVSGYLTTSGTITGATSNNEMTSDFILIGGGNVVTVLYEVDNRAVHQPWVCVQWFKADKTFGGQLVRGTIPWDRQWLRFIIPTDGVYVRVAARHLSSGYGALAVKLGYSSFYLSDYGSIGIVSSNANVADPSNVFDSYFISTEPYSYGLQSTTALEQTMGFIPLEGAERIGFSVDGCASDMTQDTTGGFVRILFMDDNGDRVALEETIARSHFTYTASTITMNNPIAVPAGATMATICFRTYGGTPCIRLDGSNEFVEYQGTRTDIDLQGHALRSLPDGTHDEMRVDSLGRVTMTQRVGVVDLGTLSWTYKANGYFDWYNAALSAAIRRPTSGSTLSSSMCTHYSEATSNAIYNNTSGTAFAARYSNGDIWVRDSTAGTDATTFKQAMSGVTLLYPLATPQTIDLGTIDLPAPADTLWLDAALVPTMGATWWTVDGIAGQQALEAEVTERQTLIRQFSGGVLAGYVGNAIAALVNAAGSFDVVQTAWTDGVPSILGTLATFGANLIRIGEETGQNVLITSTGQLFRDKLNNLLALLPGKSMSDSFVIVNDPQATEIPSYTLSATPASFPTIKVNGEVEDPDQFILNGDVLTFSGDTPYWLWDGQTMEVIYRTSPAMVLYDGEGNTGENIVASFEQGKVSLAKKPNPDATESGEIEFFDGDASLKVRHTGDQTFVNLEAADLQPPETSSGGIQMSNGSLSIYASSSEDTSGADYGYGKASINLYSGQYLDAIEMSAETLQLRPGDGKVGDEWNMTDVINAINRALYVGRRYTSYSNVSISSINTDCKGTAYTPPYGVYIIIAAYTFAAVSGSGTRTVQIGARYNGTSGHVYTVQEQGRAAMRIQLVEVVNYSSGNIQPYVRSNMTCGSNQLYMNLIRIAS